MAGEKADIDELNEEYDACRKLGVDVQLCTEAPLPLIEGTSALKFANQGRFLSSLARRLPGIQVIALVCGCEDGAWVPALTRTCGTTFHR